jgi:hypothetical protein
VDNQGFAHALSTLAYSGRVPADHQSMHKGTALLAVDDVNRQASTPAKVLSVPGDDTQSAWYSCKLIEWLFLTEPSPGSAYQQCSKLTASPVPHAIQ